MDRLKILIILGLFFSVIPAALATGMPERIVSTNLCTDELLLRLAEPRQIAGLTHYPKTPEAAERLKSAPHVREVRGNDVESILSFDPDLVLAGVFTDPGAIHFLKTFSIPVVVLDVPGDFEDIYHNIRLVAQAIGQEKVGNDTIQKMKSELVQLTTHKLEAKKIIFYQWRGYAPGMNTFEHEIMQLSGLENIAAELGIEGYGTISLEEFLMQEPDILLFSSDEKEIPSVGQILLTHPAIDNRFPNAKTLILPSNILNCGTPATVQAVRLLVNQLKSDGDR